MMGQWWRLGRWGPYLCVWWEERVDSPYAQHLGAQRAQPPKGPAESMLPPTSALIIL